MWIGFDLDSTLCRGQEKWKGYTHIGRPIKRMVDLCKAFIAAGWRVKIFTARVADVDMEDGYTPEMSAAIVRDWCVKHIGKELEVTCMKDRWTEFIIDDRVIEIDKNKGRFIVEGARSSVARDRKIRIIRGVKEDFFDGIR